MSILLMRKFTVIYVPKNRFSSSRKVMFGKSYEQLDRFAMEKAA